MIYHDKFYAVKNDKGEFAHIEMDELTWETGFATVWLSLNKPYAERTSSDYGGHVVELAEAPAKIVVSEEEAKMLKKAKCDDDPAELIVGFINSHDEYDDDRKAEDRLVRAYVVGWVVAKPKRWNVKVPHTADELYWKRGNGNIGCTGAWRTDDEIVRNRTFTDAEIEHYGLQDCERVEVTDDEQ